LAVFIVKLSKCKGEVAPLFKQHTIKACIRAMQAKLQAF